uniref:Zf-RVT domain-containing protein n=1 Tax=Anopheles funestus TaxID=62324 RepID=A0A182S009_ANOFN
MKLNWDVTIHKFAHIFWQHKNRDLTLNQKAILCNTFITSKLWFVGSIISYTFIENTGNPPYLLNVPSTYPCIKQIANEIAYIPLSYKQESSAKKIYRIAHEQLPLPTIVIKEPNLKWSGIWRNINNNTLSSSESSTYYALVSNKIPYKEKLHEWKIVNNPRCDLCGKIETLRHKIKECHRIEPLYIMMMKIMNENNLHCPSLDELLRPTLQGVNKLKRIGTMKIFIRYIELVTSQSASLHMSLDTLRLHLV